MGACWGRGVKDGGPHGMMKGELRKDEGGRCKGWGALWQELRESSVKDGGGLWKERELCGRMGGSVQCGGVVEQ